jgi:hypothetical protein
MQSGHSFQISEDLIQDCTADGSQALTPPSLNGAAQLKYLPGAYTRLANERPNMVFTAFADTVGRLERLIQLETEMLSVHRVIAFDDFNRKKSHALIELRRAIDAMHGLCREDIELDPKPLLDNLRAGLQRNLAVLQIHLNAANALAAIITRTIQEHDSDGTYTRAIIREEIRS